MENNYVKPHPLKKIPPELMNLCFDGVYIDTEASIKRNQELSGIKPILEDIGFVIREKIRLKEWEGHE